MLKIVLNIVYKFVFALLIVVALLTTLSVLGIPKDYRLFVVQTGSMRPAVPEGSLVLVSPSDNYGPGDVITFRKDSVVITHRIYSVDESPESARQYIVKGDANTAPDFDPVNEDQVMGKVIFSLPYAGYPVGFAKTQVGFIVLVIIPATIIIYNEILVIKKEIWRKD